jgi:glycosyltransferase involved in cell wall biosynthesis
MRVGLLIYDSINTLSGGYLYDRQLVGHLESQGDQVVIISIPWRNYLRHLADNFSRSLYRRLVELPVDILLQDELNHASMFKLNGQLKKETDYQIISIVHHLRCSELHPGWEKRLYRSIEKRYLQGVDGYVFNSHNTRQVVEDLIGGEKAFVVAFPAGDRLKPVLTLSQINTRAKQEEPLRLLFLGNVIPRKGLSILLEALTPITHHRWHLSIVGSLEMDMRYADGIVRKVKANGLDDRVKFFGPLDENELKKVMVSSQLMVIPSSYEGFGIAYLEGMGFGLPAIASAAGGAAEIITHGVDGFLIPPGNSTLLREALYQVIEDRELLAQMSRAALERFQCHPTWEDTTSRIRDFLVNMLEQRESN